MEHLNLEALARLVDEPLSEDERAHLASCTHCREELGALVEQTRTLSALPRLNPPAGEWEALMPRLQAEGLVKAVVTANGELPHAGIVDISAAVETRRAGWTRAAAAILLFAGGAAAGWGARGSGASPEGSSAPAPATTSVAVATNPPAETQTAALPASSTPDVGPPGIQAPDASPPVSTKQPSEPEPLASAAKTAAAPPEAPLAAPPETPLSAFPASPPASIEEALEWVRVYEDLYFGSLLMYRGQLENGGLTVADPVGRYFALGNVLAVTKDAVRRSPADPFLNGLMINTIAEQEATLQLISTVDDGN